jgi:hypothetical protein
VAVEVRFALPQQVEVGAVQDIDALQVFSDRSRASAAACYTLIITSYHMLINLLSYYY